MPCPNCKHSGTTPGTGSDRDWLVCSHCGTRITSAKQPKRGWEGDAVSKKRRKR